MPRIPEEGVGLRGQSAKAEWLGEALEAEHDRREAEFRKKFPLPKGATPMPSIPFERPWSSLGQAPSEENLNESAYGGSA